MDLKSKMTKVLFLALLLGLFSFEVVAIEKSEKVEIVVQEELEDTWSYKEFENADSKAISLFRKNLGVEKFSGNSKYTELIYLTVFYEPSNAHGFPGKTEYEKMSAFEENDIPLIADISNSFHVASVVQNGVMDFLFYISDSELFIDAVNQNNQKLQDFKVELELVNDPNWDIYKDFP